MAMVTITAREENGEFCIAEPLRPGLLVYWPSWLKALAVKLSRPSGQSGSYTGLIAFNPRRLKGLKGMSSHATDLVVYAKSSSSCLRVSEVKAKEQKQWRRLLTQTLWIISDHQTQMTPYSGSLFSNGGSYPHGQRPKSNWHFVGLGLNFTYFQLQFPFFVCFYTTFERELNWRSISLGNGRQRGTSHLNMQLIRMNYVPKHSREHASSEYCHMWGRKGTELIRNKQTHKQIHKQSTLLIAQISVLTVTKMDVCYC